ncbi:hypothetical protein BC936DRAFT_148633 [Jimgerdemannia flammicorona]|uniref:J domain-containing protein n=1 Tax=Jimgerdemannia flammicorona TaxID=994334 RepID=A0A433DKG5_9FUNG|nr:hypothetical protein BC936DRAFT_148633 [Jimgerdemannia flammicorona]
MTDPQPPTLDSSNIANLHYFRALALHKDNALFTHLNRLSEIEQEELKLSADIVELRYVLNCTEDTAKTAAQRCKKREVISQLGKALRKQSTTDSESRKRRDKIAAKLDTLKTRLRDDVLGGNPVPPALGLELVSDGNHELHEFLLSAGFGVFPCVPVRDDDDRDDDDRSEWTVGPLSLSSLTSEFHLHSMSARLRQSELEALQLDHRRLDSQRKQLNEAITNAVRTAHKKLSIHLHPDKLPRQPTADDLAAYQEVLAAYRCLSDPEYRAAYVKTGSHKRWMQSDKKKELDRKANQEGTDKRDSLRAKLAQATGAGNTTTSSNINTITTSSGPSRTSRLFLEGGKPHRCTLPTVFPTAPLPGARKGLTRLRVEWACTHADEFRISHYIVEAAAIDVHPPVVPSTFPAKDNPTLPQPHQATPTKTVVMPFPTTQAFTIIYCGKDSLFITEPFPPGAYCFRVRAFNPMGPGPYSMNASFVVSDPSLPPAAGSNSPSSSSRLGKHLARRVEARNALEDAMYRLRDVVGRVNKNLPLTERVLLMTELVARARRLRVEALDPGLVERAERELKVMEVQREGRETLGIWRARLKRMVGRTVGVVEETEEWDIKEEGEEEENDDGDEDEDNEITTDPTCRGTSAVLSRFISTVPPAQLSSTVRNMVMQSCLKAVEQCPRVRVVITTLVHDTGGGEEEEEEEEEEGGGEKWELVRNTPPGRCWQVVRAVRGRTDLFSKAWVAKIEAAWARVEKTCEVVVRKRSGSGQVEVEKEAEDEKGVGVDGEDAGVSAKEKKDTKLTAEPEPEPEQNPNLGEQMQYCPDECRGVACASGARCPYFHTNVGGGKKRGKHANSNSNHHGAALPMATTGGRAPHGRGSVAAIERVQAQVRAVAAQVSGQRGRAVKATTRGAAHKEVMKEATKAKAKGSDDRSGHDTGKEKKKDQRSEQPRPEPAEGTEEAAVDEKAVSEMEVGDRDRTQMVWPDEPRQRLVWANEPRVDVNEDEEVRIGSMAVHVKEAKPDQIAVSIKALTQAYIPEEWEEEPEPVSQEPELMGELPAQGSNAHQAQVPTSLRSISLPTPGPLPFQPSGSAPWPTTLQSPFATAYTAPPSFLQHRQSLPQIWGSNPPPLPPPPTFGPRYSEGPPLTPFAGWNNMNAFPEYQQSPPPPPPPPPPYFGQAEKSPDFSSPFGGNGCAPPLPSLPPYPALPGRSNSVPTLSYGFPPFTSAPPPPSRQQQQQQQQPPISWPDWSSMTTTGLGYSSTFSPFDLHASPASTTQSSASSSSTNSPPHPRTKRLTPLASLLESLQLSKYVPVFEAQEIDIDALALMTHADLEMLGIPFGPRLKIIGAVQAARNGNGNGPKLVVSPGADEFIAAEWLAVSSPFAKRAPQTLAAGFNTVTTGIPPFFSAVFQSMPVAGDAYGWDRTEAATPEGAEARCAALDGMVRGIVDG